MGWASECISKIAQGVEEQELDQRIELGSIYQ